MKCNHKKVMSKFCPECGERVHVDVVKSEILLYMKDRLDVCFREIKQYESERDDPRGESREYAKRRLDSLNVHVDRWNRWIEWVLKQEVI
jgi:hypothetical protein